MKARSYPTAPLAAASLIGGYAVAVSTGSRPLGGVVLAVGGLTCVRLWVMRRDMRIAAQLAAAGITAFVLSHVLALAVGAWPAVLLVSGAFAAIVLVRADMPALRSA